MCGTSLETLPPRRRYHKQQPHNGTITHHHPHPRPIPCPYLLFLAELVHDSLVGNHLHRPLINTAQAAATQRRRAARYRRYNNRRTSEISYCYIIILDREIDISPLLGGTTPRFFTWQPSPSPGDQYRASGSDAATTSGAVSPIQ